MDTFLVSLVNLGGGFVLAAVILLLHRDALKSFREELAAERTIHAGDMKALLTMKISQHEELLHGQESIRSLVVKADHNVTLSAQILKDLFRPLPSKSEHPGEL